MRIAVLTNLFPPDAIGGYELLGADLVARLRLPGHRVEVWTSGTSPAHDPSVHRVLELERPFDRSAFGPSERAIALWRRALVTRTNRSLARRGFRAFRPDVVLVLSQLRLGLGGARAAADLGVPTVFSFNDAHLLGFAPSTGRRARYDQGLGRDTTWQGLRFDHALCISACLRDELLAGGAPVQAARVVHQGVDRRLFTPAEGTRRPRRLLYVGQLHRYKGAHTLIEAAGRLRASGRAVEVTLVGAGDPTYTASLRAIARDEGVDVRFAGHLPRGALPAVYRAHDAFVFPSIWREPFGLTPLEAMACGVPVIGTVDGGQSELLVDGVNAVTFAAGDAGALARAVTRLDDDTLRDTIVANAQADVARRHDLDTYVAEIERALVAASSEREGRASRSDPHASERHARFART